MSLERAMAEIGPMWPIKVDGVKGAVMNDRDNSSKVVFRALGKW